MEPKKLSIKKTPKVCLGKHMLFRKPFRVSKLSILCSGQRKKLVLRNPSSPKKNCLLHGENYHNNLRRQLNNNNAVGSEQKD